MDPTTVKAPPFALDLTLVQQRTLETVTFTGPWLLNGRPANRTELLEHFAHDEQCLADWFVEDAGQGK